MAKDILLLAADLSPFRENTQALREMNYRSDRDPELAALAQSLVQLHEQETTGQVWSIMQTQRDGVDVTVVGLTGIGEPVTLIGKLTHEQAAKQLRTKAVSGPGISKDTIHRWLLSRQNNI